MRFLRISELKSDIAAGKIAEADVFKYALACISVITIANAIPYEATKVYPVEWFYAFGTSWLTIWGFRRCFLANGGVAGVGFLPRVFVLGWVMGVRVFLASCLALAVGFVALVAYAIAVNATNDFFENSFVVSAPYLFLLLVELWYWTALCGHIKDVKSSCLS
ncbi:MAG: hypothetical protein FJ077_16895 [Cyanobacteria bacterium K_DeepCast_35m_m2_023]|nr:hypothetical protein [Cyanobacteria bacterium K_DeepCast_35m_m2_023]